MDMGRPRFEKHNCFGEAPSGNFPDHLITPPNDNGFYAGFQSESLLSQIPSAGCLWNPNKALDRILSKLQEEEIPGKGYVKHYTGIWRKCNMLRMLNTSKPIRAFDIFDSTTALKNADVS